MSNVLVTGIGGNVGYGILRNIKNSYPDIELIGVNTERVSAGNHLCAKVYQVPFSTDADYIPVIQRICDKHKISLIIPSTDYEVYVLAKNLRGLPTIAASPAETSKLFLDKYLSYQAINKIDLSFAESILPSDYDGRFEKTILKPREGRGSRNLFFNPKNPKEFSDEYVVQPLLVGKEITTAFYVTKQNRLHGHITLSRQLAGGATNSCEVVLGYDAEIERYLSKLIQKIDIKGSCNMQSIVTDHGVVPFEFNCRISGTNSIRSQFGFKDVSYTVEEYLYNRLPEKVEIVQGASIRILHDIIYPGKTLAEIGDRSDEFYIYE
jgi:carbamoyl-phosphate synthase large subunit